MKYVKITYQDIDLIYLIYKKMFKIKYIDILGNRVDFYQIFNKLPKAFKEKLILTGHLKKINKIIKSKRNQKTQYVQIMEVLDNLHFNLYNKYWIDDPNNYEEIMGG